MAEVSMEEKSTTDNRSSNVLDQKEMPIEEKPYTIYL